jgi:hypothetical protein
MQDRAEMVAWQEEWKEYILNGNAQDEAEPKPGCLLARSLVTGRILSLLKCFK